MPTISIRISDEEKRKLQRHGNVSDTVREAIEAYLREQKSKEVIQKLAELQTKYRVSVDVEEIVRTIREGRSH